jgi:Flp pilus assembly pilin Flp
MNRLPVGHPAIDYLILVCQARHQRLRAGGPDRGASAVEWIVISAIVVAIVVAVGFIIRTALNGKAQEVSKCIEGADGSSGGC